MTQRTREWECRDCGGIFDSARPMGVSFCPECLNLRAIEQRKVIHTHKFQRRFFAKIRKDDGCWEWTGSVDRTGYGKINVGGTLVPSHKVSYEIHIGPMPMDCLVRQTCNNRACVNPGHLVLWSATERTVARQYDEDGNRTARTHCGRGHEFTPENTYIWDGQPTMRHCMTCRHGDVHSYEERRGAARVEGVPIPKKVRLSHERFAFYDRKCWMCGGDADGTDHVKPLVKGGAHMWCNLRPACASCNASKNDCWPISTGRVWRDLVGIVGSKGMRSIMVYDPMTTKEEVERWRQISDAERESELQHVVNRIDPRCRSLF